MNIKYLAKKILGVKVTNYLRLRLKSNIDHDFNVLSKRRSFMSQFLSSGDLYFDIGANMGNRIEPIFGTGIKIIAVEPQPMCISYLKRKYGNQITIIPKGVGASILHKKMFISDSHTISSFSKDWIESTKNSGRFSDYSWHDELTVEMTTLDLLIQEYGKPNFIKIDVEGYELDVLIGLSEPINFISFEYTVPERLQCVYDCIDRIISISGTLSIEFNYSIGESMEWALTDWASATQFKSIISSDEFIKSGFGDIYSKILIN